MGKQPPLNQPPDADARLAAIIIKGGKSKPNIERLWDAVSEYNRQVAQATGGDPKDLGRAFDFARQLFKQRLGALGVADHFDWTDEDGSAD